MMNGIDKITIRIQAEAQAEINRILSEARTEASQITEKYKAQAEAEAAELSAKNQRAAKERAERLESSAQMEAKKIALAAKQEMVDRAYQRALQKLCALPEEEYIEVLSDLMLEAAPSGRGFVIFSRSDRTRVGEQAVARANEKLNGGRLRLDRSTRPIQGGFILRDGNVEVNCTFETLVRLQKSETSQEVVRMLFPRKVGRVI